MKNITTVPKLPDEVQILYTIKLLGKTFVAFDEKLNVVRGYVFEGKVYIESRVPIRHDPTN